MGYHNEDLPKCLSLNDNRTKYLDIGYVIGRRDEFHGAEPTITVGFSQLICKIYFGG